MKRTLPFALLSLAACNDDAGFDTEPVVVQDVITSNRRPPALSGGTMLLIDDGARSVVADPDRDRVLIADLRSDQLQHAIALPEGAEPGRVVRDASGLVHVALRGAGALATIDPDRGALVARRAVCADPRGVAVSHARGSASLIVACASGEWVELDAQPQGSELERHYLEPDLRDVVVLDDGSLATRRLLISSFRSAEVLAVGPDGAVQRSRAPGYVHPTSHRAYEADVAWRMIPSEDGALMIHQRAATTTLGQLAGDPDSGGLYYGSVDCASSAVHGAFASVAHDGTVGTSRGLGLAVLPVDIALRPKDPARGRPALIAYASTALNIVGIADKDDPVRGDGCDEDRLLGATQGVIEPIAVGLRASDNGESTELVVQTREPSRLIRFDAWSFEQLGQVELGGESRADSGYALFHGNPDGTAMITCASCHPEGGDDGHTWSFPGVGERRTQSLAGDVLATAPFHWEGDLPDLESLVRAVYQKRMGGAPQIPERVDALERWLGGTPSPGRPRTGRVDVEDPAAVARGRALFESASLGCAACHNGPTLTDNSTRDVGTGEPLQVPSLKNLAARAPYMHDGCAKTIEQRFTPECGGDGHGDLSPLDRGQRADLLAYLLSL